MSLLPPDPIFCIKGEMGHIQNICFISDECTTTELIAASDEGYVYIWNLKTYRLRLKQKLGSELQSIHYVDSHLITQEKGGIVQLWSFENDTFTALSNCKCNGGYCRSIIINDILLLPHIDSSIMGVGVNTLEEVNVFKPLKEKLGYVMCLEKVEINNQLYLIAGYETGDVVLWDFITTNQCSSLKMKEYVTSITFDSVLLRGACGNPSNQLQIFTINGDLEIKLKCEIGTTNDGCNVVKLRSDHKIMGYGGWDGSVRLYSWRTLRTLVVLKQHHKAVTDLKFTPNVVAHWNSPIMAVGSSDGSVSLWNLYNDF